MRNALVIALLLLLCNCATRIEKSTLVLEYTDFGPQAMAYKTLGPKNLQWEPNVPLLVGQGRVFVVVYRDIPLADVAQYFPSDQAKRLDYRYLQYGDALNYLDARISQNLLRKVTQRLRETRQKIIYTLH